MSTHLTLHGRDADGFVEGSAEQRDFRRTVRKKRELQAEADQFIGPRARRGGWPVDHQKNLEPPAWARGEEPGDMRMRYRDREKARRSARFLGVPVPGWAVSQPRRRYGQVEEER
jgi:hypothetical protein